MRIYRYYLSPILCMPYNGYNLTKIIISQSQTQLTKFLWNN